ncbi:hypothetical protein AVEN_261558-1 [Araneus ventricosus]|uniref:Uncharacterized protein n=1 Tax=Araneus ventricosus TaxID=182803 RepID=A0A4Y2JXT3_ARAVE|nr:hypothetical protein AVEN_261558-1 [Araneus ventricosus]
MTSSSRVWNTDLGDTLGDHLGDEIWDLKGAGIFSVSLSAERRPMSPCLTPLQRLNRLSGHRTTYISLLAEEIRLNVLEDSM